MFNFSYFPITYSCYGDGLNKLLTTGRSVHIAPEPPLIQEVTSVAPMDTTLDSALVGIGAGTDTVPAGAIPEFHLTSQFEALSKWKQTDAATFGVPIVMEQTVPAKDDFSFSQTGIESGPGNLPSGMPSRGTTGSNIQSQAMSRETSRFDEQNTIDGGGEDGQDIPLLALDAPKPGMEARTSATMKQQLVHTTGALDLRALSGIIAQNLKNMQGLASGADHPDNIESAVLQAFTSLGSSMLSSLSGSQPSPSLSHQETVNQALRNNLPHAIRQLSRSRARKSSTSNSPLSVTFSPDIANPGLRAASGRRAPFRCQTCGASFDLPCQLTKHIQRHTKPYKCTHKGCDKSFGAKSDWKRHEHNKHPLPEGWRCGFEFASESPSHGLPSSPEKEKAKQISPSQTAGAAQGNQQRPTCGAEFHCEKDFVAHVQRGHGVVPSSSDYQALNRKSRMAPNGQGGFWCGFCRRVVPLEEHWNAAWNERFDHIECHFKEEKKGMEGWEYLKMEDGGDAKPMGTGDAGDPRGVDIEMQEEHLTTPATGGYHEDLGNEKGKRRREEPGEGRLDPASAHTQKQKRRKKDYSKCMWSCVSELSATGRSRCL